ncbi:OmpA family protein [Streptobacillus moniliformis]|uniref:OmpA family protein n=1 Tax=Streptobacillus moniliformis TaxID=34105 RepID=UPI0007E4D2ED|nr:OmpA family protein [Streptobacillus moniliformis]
MKKLWISTLLIISATGYLSYSNNNTKPNTSITVKADKDAANLETDDINKWKNKLGIADISKFENLNKAMNNFDNLNNISKNASSGVASAIATASTMKNLGNNKHTISGSVGYYGKETAGAISYSTHYKNFGFGANASFNSRLEFGAGAGFSYTFGKGEKEVINVVAPTLAIDENESRIENLEKENKEIKEELIKLSKLIKSFDENKNKVEDIYTIYGFNSNKFILNKKQIDVIDALVPNLQNREIIVIGYTDTDGNDKYNLELGLNRANSVKVYLENKGIKVNQIRTVGFNELITNNNTLENKSLNRRVELIVK